MRRNFHTKRRVIVALLFCCFIFACKNAQQQKSNSFSCNEGFEKVIVVNKTGLDGCGFMLQRADSSAFEVNNFPDSLKVEGKTFCIKFHVAKQQMSICMGGQRIDILEVKLP
jgi:hypothetical protein